MLNILRKNGSRYNFELEDGKFGTTYGLALLMQHFPDAYQVEGQSVYRVPSLEALTGQKARVVVTCRQLVRI